MNSLTHVSALALTGSVLVGCASPLTIDAPPPVAVGSHNVSELAPLASSVVDAPIMINLSPALAALEEAVPSNFGNLEQRIQNPSNSRQHFAFEAARTRFDVDIDDGLLTMGTTVSYAGRGWYNPPLLPEIGASCGVDTDRPRLRARLRSNVGMTADWKIRTRTRLAALTPVTDTERDECRITAFSIDVTNRVASAVSGLMEKQLPRLDRRLAGLNVRSQIEKWYNEMNRPIRVADSLWLLLKPGVVGLGGINVSDSMLVFDIRLKADPVIISGEQPERIDTPLPRLDTTAMDVGDSARVLLEARIEYPVASELLRKNLVGRSFRKWYHKVEVEDVRLLPVGDGRVALGIRFKGAVRGEGWLVGTPVLDVEREELTVPDLDFDVATGDLLVRGLSFLKTAGVLEDLRAAAVLPLGPALDALREKVEGAINRDLTDGVRLSAQLRTGRVIDVLVSPEALIARAEAKGSLGLAIDRDLSFGERK